MKIPLHNQKRQRTVVLLKTNKNDYYFKTLFELVSFLKRKMIPYLINIY